MVLLSMHHIISDGWSLGVLVRELAALYRAFAQGQPSPLPELPVQYADYAVWQRQWLQGERLQSQLAYWKQRLAGLAPLELPTDRPRPAVQTFRGATLPVTLPRELAAGLQALSRQEGATLFMTLLAGWQALLARYSGQSDVAVGAPVANRTRVETEGLIGFFVNTLVLRADLGGGPSFRAALGRVREAVLAAYAQQDVPFEQVVEAVQPPRDLSRTPLFQVMFAWQNAPLPTAVVGELRLRPVAVEAGTAKFDLTLDLAEAGEEIAGTLEYNTDLFERETIARLAGHLQTLLAGAVAGPERPLHELPLLGEGERRQVLVEWNQTAAAYPQDVCVHELFEQQVERSPDAVAVVSDETELTYAELNGRANRLARQLRGARRPTGGAVVAILLERSVDLIVAQLAVLKAGGAYLPLDPNISVRPPPVDDRRGPGAAVVC